MGFIPSELINTLPNSEVNYRLERKRVLVKYASGEASIHEVCDAHPELLRAAHNYAVPMEGNCPICEEATLVVVTYVFGPRLPSHGRCVNSQKDHDHKGA